MTETPYTICHYEYPDGYAVTIDSIESLLFGKYEFA